MTFNQLNIIEPILKALSTEGYSTPTPIQEQAIPVILDGNDILGCAQTGTGKTAAFSIPIIQRLHLTPSFAKQRPIRALVITPTRELAIQIDESFQSYGCNTQLRHRVIFGGVGQQPQTNALQRGVDVLIATPGRLLDLIGQGFIDLKHVEFFVLDEADRMLDMGFIHDIKRILPLLPQKKQTLFFSATMPPEISKLANSILHHPVRVEVSPVSSTVDTVEQKIYHVEKDDKNTLLIELLSQGDMRSVLVFTRTKHGADKIVKVLLRAGIRSAAIHGNKSQNARQKALGDFKDGAMQVLVATDIAARGIDIDNLSHVVNYDLPNIPETYVHRIGRTGRAGCSGIALSFCATEEREFLRDIQKLIGFAVDVEKAHGYATGGDVPFQTAPASRAPKTKQHGKPHRGQTNHPRYRNQQSAGSSDDGNGNRDNAPHPTAKQGPDRQASLPDRTNSGAGRQTNENTTTRRNNRHGFKGRVKGSTKGN